VAEAAAAAIGRLGRANVSVSGGAWNGESRRRRGGRIGETMLSAYLLVEGAVRLRCGPTVYPEVGPISTVGLGEPLRKTLSRPPLPTSSTGDQPSAANVRPTLRGCGTVLAHYFSICFSFSKFVYS
jgi:hypothetical protein